MNISELLHLRMYNHLLSANQLGEASEIVSWMGAMQSQSLDLAKWGIGVRMKDGRVGDINKSLNTAKIIRTHILRPTWHFVSAEDIHWMYDLSNDRLKPIYRSYIKGSGVNEDLVFRIACILDRILSSGEHFTKQELGDLLKIHNLESDSRHLDMAIFYAEIEGILVNGRLKGNKQTFTSFEKWVPRTQTMHRDDALGCLALKFFTSHSPATLDDFVWWSGLTLKECRNAIEMIKDKFVYETINGRLFLINNEIRTPDINENFVLFLPPFDEFVVSYKNRSELIDDRHYGKVMTKNGIFSPTLMLNGEIIGSWKKRMKGREVSIDLSFFEKPTKIIEGLFLDEIKRLKSFYNDL